MICQDLLAKTATSVSTGQDTTEIILRTSLELRFTSLTRLMILAPGRRDTLTLGNRWMVDMGSLGTLDPVQGCNKKDDAAAKAWGT